MAETIADVIEVLRRSGPFEKAAGWDPVGLQIGDLTRAAERIAVCHEITATSVEELTPYDLVIVYHPLVFRPLTRIVAGSGPGGRAFRLLESGTAVAVMHTNFDTAPGGTGDALASALGIADASGFGPLDGQPGVKVTTFVPAERADAVVAAMSAAGAGRIGNYSACSFRVAGSGSFLPDAGADPYTGVVGTMQRAREVRVEMVAPKSHEPRVIAALVAAHPYEEPAFDVIDARSNSGMIGRVGDVEPQTVDGLAEVVGEQLGGTVRVAGAGDVSRVAVVPGSGGDYIRMARAAGAGVMVTGDISHHQARAALDVGLAIIDPGHAPTERPGIRALYAAVRDIGADVQLVAARDTDPWERN